MSQKSLMVTDEDGLRGAIENPSDSLDAGEPKALVRLEDGQAVMVPKSMLRLKSDGSYYLPASLRALARSLDKNGVEEGGEMVVPVIVEELEVGKRKVETGRVRVTKTVHEREEIVDPALLTEEVDIERVVIGEIVDGPLPVRSQGDVTIIPVHEEVIVVEKRLMLKEELHIIKRRIETHDPQRVTLRGEEVTIERINAKTPEGRQ